MSWVAAFFLGAYAALLPALWRLRGQEAPEGAVAGYALLMLMGGVLGVAAWLLSR